MIKLMFFIPLLTTISWDKMKIMLIIIMMAMMSILYSPGTQMNFLTSISMLSQTSIILIMLSIWIVMLMIMSSRSQIMKKTSNMLFLLMMLWLTATMMLVFSMKNMLMFYISFEMSIIPTMLLILLWGYQPERLQASMYLSMYTIVASLPLLASLMMFFKMNLYFSFLTMMMQSTQETLLQMNHLMLIPLLTAFLVKTPMFSVHLWLPKAHVEAPMSGSMILAAILLKLGGYGMMMMNYIISNTMINKTILCLAAIGGAMASAMCLSQTDMKSLIAYSSINHMALMIIGIMTNFNLGVKMALTIMLAHGMSSSALFMMAGMSFKGMQSRMLFLSKSTALLSPTITMLWFIIIMINMGAPPSINLLSEIFLMMSALMFMKLMLLLILIMIMLSSAYNLFLYTTLNHGPPLKYNSFKNTSNFDFMLPYLLHTTPIIMLITSIQYIV